MDLEEGEYASIRLWTDSPGEEDEIRISASSITDKNGSPFSSYPPSKVSHPQVGYYDTKSGLPDNLDVYPGELEFRVYAESDRRTCIGLFTDGDHSGEWRMSLTYSDETPPSTGTNDSDDVAELEQELEEKEETISELQDTIAEQEQQIEELEAQIEDSDGDTESMIIEVTVKSGGNQNSFQSGGTALIEAESEQADVSNLAIEYKGDIYNLGDTGEAELPLVGTGEQELTFTYDDVTEIVSITVEAAETDEDDPSDTDEESAGGIEELPGFGLIVAVIAILLFALLYSRNLNRESRP